MKGLTLQPIELNRTCSWVLSRISVHRLPTPPSVYSSPGINKSPALSHRSLHASRAMRSSRVISRASVPPGRAEVTSSTTRTVSLSSTSGTNVAWWVGEWEDPRKPKLQQQQPAGSIQRRIYVSAVSAEVEPGMTRGSAPISWILIMRNIAKLTADQRRRTQERLSYPTGVHRSCSRLDSDQTV